MSDSDPSVPLPQRETTKVPALQLAEIESALGGPPELSVVLPCLNEADTLETCIKKALQVFTEKRIRGEVVVADNGSTDGSQEIARRLGARVIPVEARGYGSALRGGIAAARAPFILMADADDSYDLLEIYSFLVKLRDGNQLVQGCRLPAGGGKVMPGAMPRSHRWLGNPMFSLMARRMFGAKISDVYCGMRAFTRDLYDRLDLRCTGMEFATEMIIKTSMRDFRMVEVPITYHKDGRKSHPPHLRTIRDGWRTLRFLLMYSPRWLYRLPGYTFIAIGLLGFGLALPGFQLFGSTLDAHTLLCASLAIVLGYQALLFASFTKTFAINEHLLPPDEEFLALGQETLESGLLQGLLTMGLGVLLILVACHQWANVHFGRLDYSHTMRWVIPGSLLVTLGSQRVLGSFFLGILQLKKQR